MVGNKHIPLTSREALMTEPGSGPTVQPHKGLAEDTLGFLLNGGSFHTLFLLVLLEDREQQKGYRGQFPAELEQVTSDCLFIR